MLPSTPSMPLDLLVGRGSRADACSLSCLPIVTFLFLKSQLKQFYSHQILSMGISESTVKWHILITLERGDAHQKRKADINLCYEWNMEYST